MKKTIAIFALIFALLLTTGCAASNAAPMEARTLDVQPAAETPTEAVVDEQTEAPTEISADEPTAIGKDKALQIALEHAGVAAEKATQTQVEYDKEDGEYDVEFRYNNYEYDYSIHVTTGKVLKHEKEYDGPVETKPAATEKAAEKATKATEKATQATKATEATKTVIGKDKAKSIALDHAGVSASKAANVVVEYEKDDQEYEVDFRAGDYEYDYTIGAYSGKVLKHDKEYDPIETKPKATEPKPTEAAAKTVIGKDKAKSIALDHAGVSSSKATNVTVEYDKEDKEYEVDFRAGDYEYEYTIAAYSGKVLKHDKEYDPIETKPKETQPKENEPIGKDKAKQIALDHAGVSSSKATNVTVEYDKEDKEYEVDFRAGDYEYEYTIAAYSGKILEHDKEYDPVETKPKEETVLIGKDKAKSIALKHAGFSAEEVSGLKVEYEKDDGIPVYEVEFYKDRLEYTYEIHGETGEILSREIDD